MSTEAIFEAHLVLGYVAWLLCFGTYIFPRLKAMDGVAAQRAIATLHSRRFFGLVFILPGVLGPNLPASFSSFAAYGDFATGLLALLALDRHPDTSGLLAVRRCLHPSWELQISFSTIIMPSRPAFRHRRGR